MKKKKIYPYGSVVIAMLFWGMSFVWTAIVLKYYQPITIIFLRLIISTALLFTGLKLFGKIEKIDRKDYKLFLLSALFNPFFYFMGENYGIKLTSPTISAVIIATIPLFTPIVAFFTLKEKLTSLNILGLIVSFSGVFIMLVNNKLSFDTPPLGILFLLFAVASAIGFSIYLKKLSKRYSPFFIIATQNLIGVVYFLPFFIFFGFNEFLEIKPNFELLGSLFALAVFCSSLAFVAYTVATREIGVSKTNVFANLIPVFTGIFSYFIISEQLDSQKILGIVIVVSGLFFSQIKIKKIKP